MNDNDPWRFFMEIKKGGVYSLMYKWNGHLLRRPGIKYLIHNKLLRKAPCHKGLIIGGCYARKD